MNHYAVIPSCCRREELTNLVNTLVADNVTVIVVDTGYEDRLDFDTPWFGSRNVVRDHEQPRNISRWWNRGLQFAADVQTWSPSEEYIVAVLNDDVIVRPGFVQQLGRAIIRHDVVAASANVWGFGLDRVFRGESPRVMAGFAFALRGKTGLRADEDFVWWGGDTDLDVRAQRNGGLVVVAEATVQHLYPNSTTVGELAEQAGRDRETFKRKHGFYAW